MPSNILIKKRIFDLFITSIIFAITFFPSLILILICTIDTGKCGIFSQIRIGKDGKKFKILKLRTMKNIKFYNTNITTSKDPRITSLGRLIRKYKLDELPQMINVFKGEMSLVGPRPDLEEFINLIPHQERIILLSVPPGVTGPASIVYRNEEKLLSNQDDPYKYNNEVILPSKTRLNLNYINNWNIFLDIKIIIKSLFLPFT